MSKHPINYEELSNFFIDAAQAGGEKVGKQIQAKSSAPIQESFQTVEKSVNGLIRGQRADKTIQAEEREMSYVSLVIVEVEKTPELEPIKEQAKEHADLPKITLAEKVDQHHLSDTRKMLKNRKKSAYITLGADLTGDPKTAYRQGFKEIRAHSNDHDKIVSFAKESSKEIDKLRQRKLSMTQQRDNDSLSY